MAFAWRCEACPGHLGVHLQGQGLDEAPGAVAQRLPRAVAPGLPGGAQPIAGGHGHDCCLLGTREGQEAGDHARQ